MFAPRPLETLRDALRDRQSAADMNNAPFRHVLVIDESGHGLGVLLNLLRDHHQEVVSSGGHASAVELVYVSDFAGE